jgi:integrase
MTYTFNLKEPKSNKDTLILFSCYFKNENKKFVYSTGEKVHPQNWDFENRFIYTSGKNKPKQSESIKIQLNRYSNLFIETESLYKRIDEEFDSKILRIEFDKTFKKSASGKNLFFDSYDEFTAQKIKGKEWSNSTIARYQNIRNILLKFEKEKNFILTFSKIDDNFHREFTSFCMDSLNHINTTYARNLGLFKTFMYWALKNKLTFNSSFIEFKKVDKVITNQIALTIEDLNKLMDHNFKTFKLEKVRDVFVFQCLTGMRFGELSLISKSNIINDTFILKEDKDKNKKTREIPLTKLSKYILEKYDYELPLIQNQKQNEYIKDVFKELEYNSLVQKITTKGKENIIADMPFYNRVSTHTARRTFITMMKRQGKSDKLIASITGHTDMKTLNQYYQISDPEKKEAMDEVFNVRFNSNN